MVRHFVFLCAVLAAQLFAQHAFAAEPDPIRLACTLTVVQNGKMNDQWESREFQARITMVIAEKGSDKTAERHSFRNYLEISSSGSDSIGALVHLYSARKEFRVIADYSKEDAWFLRWQRMKHPTSEEVFATEELFLDRYTGQMKFTSRGEGFNAKSEGECRAVTTRRF